MRRSFRSASIGLAMTRVMGMTLLLGMFAALSPGCGTIDANGFLGLETCDILNCDGLFFRNFADGHDDMAGMDSVDDADAHEDESDEHMDDVDDHDDDGGDDDHIDDAGDHDNSDDEHMDDMDGHDDDDAAEEEEHDDATEGDDGSGPTQS